MSGKPEDNSCEDWDIMAVVLKNTEPWDCYKSYKINIKYGLISTPNQ